MKKLSLVVLTCFIFFGHVQKVNGQAAILVLLLGDKVASENFYFSFKLGANVGNLQGIDDTAYKARLNFGLLANIRLTKKLFLIPEFAAISGKGAKNIPYLSSGIPELDELVGEPSKSHMRLRYLDMPIIARYNINERFSIGTGPQFSILTASEIVYESSVQDKDKIVYWQGSQLDWNKYDFGWTGEVAYRISKALGGKTIDLHLRYTKGFTDIIENNPGDAVTNSVFQFAVSLPFIKEDPK
jgi:Outer membrane protein beta-barrel domain